MKTTVLFLLDYTIKRQCVTKSDQATGSALIISIKHNMYVHTHTYLTASCEQGQRL